MLTLFSIARHQMVQPLLVLVMVQMGLRNQLLKAVTKMDLELSMKMILSTSIIIRNLGFQRMKFQLY
jgi:hypothetical protein